MPQTGRWASRDTMEENGGINQFEFTNNAPVFLFDSLGKYATTWPTLGAICAEILAGVTLPAWGPWVAGGAIVIGGVTYLLYTRTGTYTETIQVYRDQNCQCSNAEVNSVPQTVTQTKTVPSIPHCLPCIPANGTSLCRTDAGAGHGCLGPFHTHHFFVYQLPPPSCSCTKQYRTPDVTCDALPGLGESQWYGPILGGGLAP